MTTGGLSDIEEGEARSKSGDVDNDLLNSLIAIVMVQEQMGSAVAPAATPYWAYKPIFKRQITLRRPRNELMSRTANATTRSKSSSFFMNRFMGLGFNHYNCGLRVHSLLNVVLRD